MVRGMGDDVCIRLGGVWSTSWQDHVNTGSQAMHGDVRRERRIDGSTGMSVKAEDDGDFSDDDIGA